MGRQATALKRKAGSALRNLMVDRVDGVDKPATGEDFLVLKEEDPDELRKNIGTFLATVAKGIVLLAKRGDIEWSEKEADALNDIVELLALDEEDESADGEDEITFKARKKGGKPGEDGYGPKGDNRGKRGHMGTSHPDPTGTAGKGKRRKKSEEDEDEVNTGREATDETEDEEEEEEEEEDVRQTATADDIAKGVVDGLAPMFAQLASAITGRPHSVEKARKEKPQSRQPDDDERDRKPVTKEAPKLGSGLFKNIMFDK